MWPDAFDSNQSIQERDALALTTIKESNEDEIIDKPNIVVQSDPSTGATIKAVEMEISSGKENVKSTKGAIALLESDESEPIIGFDTFESYLAENMKLMNENLWSGTDSVFIE